jgi:MoaA/NifB/PqqE/SkfB family radical SAM enzyme
MIILKKNFIKHFIFAVYRKAYIFIYWKIPFILPAIKNPHILNLELTNDCNLRCIHCFRNKMNRDIGYMDINIFRRLIDEISSYPVAFIRMIGRGEPAIHPDLKQIMEFLKGMKIKVEFCTNGIIFERYPPEEILEWNIDLLDVSVDGTNRESYNKIRKNGDYDLLRKNISNFYYTRNKLKRSSPKINIRNVIFPGTTREHIEEFKINWRSVSDMVIFNEFNPLVRSGVNSRENIRCRSDIFFTAYIRWDGRIAKCAHQGIYEEEQYIGDLNSDDLRVIWNKPELRELRSLNYKRDYDKMPVCRQCYYNATRDQYNPMVVLPR